MSRHSSWKKSINRKIQSIDLIHRQWKFFWNWQSWHAGRKAREKDSYVKKRNDVTIIHKGRQLQHVYQQCTRQRVACYFRNPFCEYFREFLHVISTSLLSIYFFPVFYFVIRRKTVIYEENVSWKIFSVVHFAICSWQKGIFKGKVERFLKFDLWRCFLCNTIFLFVDTRNPIFNVKVRNMLFSFSSK